jgi:diguanylate cyclase (GGDEF)-like protein
MVSGFLQRRHLASAYQDHRRAIIDLIVIVSALAVIYWLIRDLDLFEKLSEFTQRYEAIEIDEIVIVVLLSVMGLIAFGARRLQDQRREIKARQRAEDRAQYLALADTLTGLPNRRQFETRLNAAFAKVREDHRRFALMMVDLDRFKPVNDVFGHAVGDQVLIAFAKRAAGLVGSDGMLARFGGDEFAILFGPIADVEEATRLARRLVAAVARPFEAAGTEVTLGASIGVAVAPQDGVASEELMRRADIALYRAKTSGRNHFRFFEAEMDAQVKRRAQIEHDLRAAIEAGGIQPHYQPIVDLTNGAIIGFEALARWEHPLFGELAPEQFIAIAEDAGLITQLAANLLRRAARDATQWPATVELSFNISRMQLTDPMLVLRVLQVLAETGLSPTRLEVEISEGLLGQRERRREGSAQRFPRGGNPHRARRFRHRQFKPQAAARMPFRSPQDRSQFRRVHGRLRRKRDFCQRHPRFVAGTRLAGQRGGHRERTGHRAAARARLLRGPGLPVQRSGAGGRSAEAARRQIASAGRRIGDRPRLSGSRPPCAAVSTQPPCPPPAVASHAAPQALARSRMRRM